MKIIIYIICCFCFYCISSCSPLISQTTQQTKRHFLYRTGIDNSDLLLEAHVEVKQVLPKTDELIPMSIDDRDIIGRSKYSRDDRIKILAEYLTFQGDTTVSNKRYHFKAASHMVQPEGIAGFTVEIEALYSFTRMLTVGYPPIKPALINRITGKQLNTSRKVVDEVYEIYRKWYEENKKTNFKKISLPLSGTPYCWLGEDKGIGPYIKRSF